MLLSDEEVLAVGHSLPQDRPLNLFNFARAIEAAVLAKLPGEPVATVILIGHEKIIHMHDDALDALGIGASLYAHQPDDTALLKEALYVISAWDRGCEYSDYTRDRGDAIDAIKKRLGA